MRYVIRISIKIHSESSCLGLQLKLFDGGNDTSKAKQ